MTALVILGWTAVFMALDVPLPCALLMGVNVSMYGFVTAEPPPRYVDLNKMDYERKNS